MKLIQSLLVFKGFTGQNVTTDDVLSWITSNITPDQSLFTADVSGDGPIIVARAGAQDRIRDKKNGFRNKELFLYPIKAKSLHQTPWRS